MSCVARMAAAIAMGSVIAVAALLSRPAVAAGNPAGADTSVSEEALKRGLMSSLGDSFEFLGGEFARTEASMGGRTAERFWFARVRPREAGEFAVSYTVKFHFPDAVASTLIPEGAKYLIFMKVGERDALRVAQAGDGWGGACYPHANVGDTVVIPIHVDRFCVDHTFIAPDERKLQAFFKTAGERQEWHMPGADERRMVENKAIDQLDLLASFAPGNVDHRGIKVHHSLYAYVEFKKPGAFTVAGRLADAGADEKMPGPMGGDRGPPDGDSAAIRVLPRGSPVTVVLEHMYYVERSSSSGRVPGGTIEVRVGDRLLVRCGGYTTPYNPAAHNIQALRRGLVMVLPFEHVEAYERESKE